MWWCRSILFKQINMICFVAVNICFCLFFFCIKPITIINKKKLTDLYLYDFIFLFNNLNLLPNTVTLKQVEDYIRGCSTSTKYCRPWTSWRLYQRVFYFYQILSPLNKLKTISEGVLLLPNTVALEQAEDCIRGCSTST